MMFVGGADMMWNQLGSTLATVMFVYALYKQYFPYELRGPIEKYVLKLIGYVHPYIQITFCEYNGGGFERSPAYATIERYLGTKSSPQAKRLKADMVKDSQSLVLSMDDHEEITDEFQGIRIWWVASKTTPKTQVFSFYGRSDEERRSYKLKFHRRHRDIITQSYLSHVLEQGKAIAVRTRQRKLYTNNRGEQWWSRRPMWSHIVFEHPATFDTLAMEAEKKQEIIDDLITFSQSKDYYAKIGKAWKRGYLLYGPPGTGKSSMIAAMANLLEYDVYDLELTAVKDNTELRKLLIDTSSKSIIVIEDIDCSLDLTGQRKKDKEKDEKKEDEKDPIKKPKDEDESKSTKVTLSGLLNFIDGLWSACRGERLIIFTTNYVEKLDPALIRRGRMDKRIELSYCGFEAFKVLAKNYLDLESHSLYGTIGRLLEETNMTPADVAENLMPKSAKENAEICLNNLIEALETAKEEAKLKAEEEARLKAEKEEEDKKKKEQSDEEAKKKEASGEEENEVKDKEEEKPEEANGKKTSAREVQENGIVT